MLFNSHIFIFAFLPVVVAVFFAVGATGRPRLALAWLFASSLFFYGWWNPSYLGVIGGSVLFNYAVGLGLSRATVGSRRRRLLLAAGVAGNLLALGYYKYANFFVDNLGIAFGRSFALETIVLPLAISFFTFQQIAYLVDSYRDRRSETNFLNYCVFVTFFPQLIAGPIVHHREMLPQFRSRRIFRFDLRNLEVGLTLFFIGLFKKVVLADGVAVHSTPVFDAAAAGEPLTVLAAWGGGLAYTLQLYFDFSGYSDMAIGLGRLFGLRLPVNFESPYKATSVIDFWRRWHMTLSRFLRDYLYVPLGGNRRGATRRYLNLMITMVLGGLWHGAGWTFVIWGALHGSYLLVNHGWRSLSTRVGRGVGTGSAVGVWASRLLTFLAVLVAWVFFRADDLDAALRMLRAMVGGGAADWGGGDWDLHAIVYLLVLTAISFFAPNSQQVMSHYDPVLEDERRGASRAYDGWLCWRPSRRWALIMAVLTVWGVLGINKLSEFLYFQF